MKLILCGLFFAVACNAIPLRLIDDGYIEREYLRLPEYFETIFKEIDLPVGLELPTKDYVLNPLYREYFKDYFYRMFPTIFTREGDFLKNDRELTINPDFTKYIWRPYWFYKLVIEPVKEMPKNDIWLQKLPYLMPSITFKDGEKVIVGMDKTPVIGKVVIPEMVETPVKPETPVVVKPEVVHPVVHPVVPSEHVGAGMVTSEHNEMSKSSSKSESSDESHSSSKMESVGVAY